MSDMCKIMMRGPGQQWDIRTGVLFEFTQELFSGSRRGSFLLRVEFGKRQIINWQQAVYNHGTGFRGLTG